ncbi:MAG: hypothetical protein IT374_16390 [Polyangiaceae bacterium]|nr:hypothetical protein [Polyangiaceae bacterium]
MLLYGPPLAKARATRLTARRVVSLVRVEPGLALSWVARADVVSEGRDDGARYFGTSSVIVPADDDATLRALASDLHVRAAVLRIARREACSRARAALDTARCHLEITLAPGRATFEVEIEAELDLARAFA